MEEEAMGLIAEGVNYSQCRQCCAHHRSEVPEYRTSPERSPGLLLWLSDFGISYHVTRPTLCLGRILKFVAETRSVRDCLSISINNSDILSGLKRSCQWREFKVLHRELCESIRPLISTMSSVQAMCCPNQSLDRSPTI
jgi:hypothetical protein